MKVLKNLRWGLGAGLFFACFFSAWVAVVYLFRGSAPFEARSVTLLSTVARYFGGGLLAGAIVGLLRSLTRWRLGAMAVGWPRPCRSPSASASWCKARSRIGIQHVAHGAHLARDHGLCGGLHVLGAPRHRHRARGLRSVRDGAAPTGCSRRTLPRTQRSSGHARAHTAPSPRRVSC
jgi:hypothetical protein